MGSPNPLFKRRPIAAIVSTFALIIGLVALSAPATATADTAPPEVGAPSTVTTTALPTPQMNGVVWSQVIVGNVDYVGGDFTSARPSGSAAGTNETPRSYLLAYNVTTGVLMSWAPVLDQQVRQLVVTPDQTKLIAVGDFTTVNGSSRNRIAEFDLPSGNLDTGFHPSANATVYTAAATNSTVYFAGNFGAVTGTTRVGTAAASVTTGALTAWNPALSGGRAWSMEVSPDATKVAIGGSFTTANGSGNPGYGLTMVDSTTGTTTLPFATNSVVQDAGVNAAIYSMTETGDALYGTGFVFGSGGNLEGTFKADWNGNLEWVEDCHGDTYSVAVQNQAVYIAGHPHYCGDDNSFPQTNPETWHRAIAFSTAATGTLSHNPYGGYTDFAGQAAPSVLDWFPDFNSGTFTGQNQGPWSIATNSQYVVYGGEFTTVNYASQEGLTRFALNSVSPDTDGPRNAGTALEPTLQSKGAGDMTVSWPADWDRDNETLTYQVYVDGKTATAAYTTTVNSQFWLLPTISWEDTGLTPGVHTFRLRATDPNGNTAWGTTVSGTVSGTGTLSAYDQAVIAAQPTNFWTLGDAAGATTANDSVGRYNGTVGSGVTFGVPGPITGDSTTAASFDGTVNGLVASSGQVWGSNTFTIDTWVNTTSSSGGKIVGFGDQNTGTSGSYDRHVYMNNAGNILFGVYPNSSQVIQSTKTYNDGRWHQIVATLSPAGMVLDIDGAEVASNPSVTTAQNYWGYWRIGGDNSWSGNPFLQGSIADTAIYPTALTQTQIDTQYNLSGRTYTPPVAPTDSYGAAVFAQNPLLFYRLNDANSTVAADSGPQANPGVYSGSYTQGVSGGINGSSDTATQFTNGVVASGAAYNDPSTYTTQIWFNTTTTTGGKLTGFGDQQSGDSSNYDRHVYMQDDGTLVFGAWTGQENLVTSPQSYNDGKWHQVTAVQSSAGMALYVDGQLVGTNPQTSQQAYTGYWRAGEDVTWGSTTNNFDGTLQDFAVYNSALSAGTILSQYEIGSGTVPNQPPVAAFTPTITGEALSVDASASTDPDGTVASYAWDFGDGSTQAASSNPTATHIYAGPGIYNIVLTVTDNDGATDTVGQPVMAVHVNQPPVAAFQSTIGALTANLDGSSSTDPDGTVASYAWDFGDGSTQAASASPTASHTYSKSGSYQVTLTVTDNSGATNAVKGTVQVTAPNVPPTASFTVANASGSSTVSVDASASSDPDGSIAGYDFSWGDGTADATTATATHTYATTGKYSIGLTVTDNQGATGTLSQNVTITAATAPTAAFTDTVSNLGVHFDASGSTAQGTITSYAWTFGDGSTGTGVSPSYTYTASGTYNVGLTVTDNHGLTNTISLPIKVTAAVASSTIASDAFARTATSGWGNADTGGAWTTSLPASSSVGGGLGVLSHTAGATRRSTLGSVSVTNADIQTDVILPATVTGGGVFAGIVSRSNSADYYQSRIRYIAGGTLAIQILQGGSTVLANATVPGTYTPGTSLTVETQISGTSPTTISARVWPTGGTKPAAWQATASSSVADLQSAGSIGVIGYASGTVTNAPVIVEFDNFTASTTGSTPPVNTPPAASFTSTSNALAASFDASQSSDNTGTITGYAWTFGDGSSGTGATPSHTYAKAGSYSVGLTVTDSNGLTGSTTSTIVISAPTVPPTAAFTSAVNTLVATLDASTSTDTDGTITGYAWNFGDGSTQAASASATATHAYATGASYTVTLTVTDNNGLTATVAHSVTVTSPPPGTPTVLASDNFGRTTTSGWGNATTGGAWTTAANTNYFVNGASGWTLVAPGASRAATLGAVSVQNVELQGQTSADQAVNTGSQTLAGLIARQVGSDYYQARVRLLPGGAVALMIMHGSSTILANATIAGVSYTPGEVLNLRMRVTGGSPTTIQTMMWPAGTAEPTTWQLTATDSTVALQGAGTIGISNYVSTAATTSVNVRWYNFSAIVPQ